MLVLTLTVPVFSACFGETPPATTTTTTTGQGGPGQTPPPQTPSDALLALLQGVLEDVRSNGASADSQINLSVKTDLIASLLGDREQLTGDFLLGGLRAPGKYDTQLHKDVYATLLAELIRLSLNGGTLDEEDLLSTLLGEGYTLSLEELGEVLTSLMEEDGPFATFLEGVQTKIENGEVVYFVNEKTLADLFANYLMNELPLYLYGPVFALRLDSTVELFVIDVQHEGDQCIKEENPTLTAAFRAAYRPLYELRCRSNDGPYIYDSEEALPLYLDFCEVLLEIGEQGLRIGYDLGADSPCFFLPTPSMLYCDDPQEALEQLRGYLETRNTRVFAGYLMELLCYEGLSVHSYSYPQGWEGTYEDMLAVAAPLRGKIHGVLRLAVEGCTYEQLRAALVALENEATALYEAGWSFYINGRPLYEVRNWCQMADAVLETLHPDPTAVSQDAVGMHTALARLLCQQLGLPMQGDGEAPSAYFVEFESLILELARAVVYGEQIDLTAHFDTLFALFEVPLTVEELKETDPLYLLALLNDTYDFKQLLLSLGQRIPYQTGVEAYQDVVDLLDRVLLSKLHLLDDGAGNPYLPADALTEEDLYTFVEGVYTLLEKYGLLNEDLAAAFETFTTDVLQGNETPFARLVQAVIDNNFNYSYIGNQPEDAIRAFEEKTVAFAAALERLLMHIENVSAEQTENFVQTVTELCSAIVDLHRSTVGGVGITGVGNIGSFFLWRCAEIALATLEFPAPDAMVGFTEALLNMEIERIPPDLAGWMKRLLFAEDYVDEQTFVALLDAWVTAFYYPEQAEDDFAKCTADLLLYIRQNTVRVDAAQWNTSFSAFGLTPMTVEEVKYLSLSLMATALLYTEDVSDYNPYFSDVELPDAVESIDYTKLYQKLADEAVYAEAVEVQDVLIQPVMSEDDTTCLGETVTVAVAFDLDLVVFTFSGTVTLTFDIVY